MFQFVYASEKNIVFLIIFVIKIIFYITFNVFNYIISVWKVNCRLVEK